MPVPSKPSLLLHGSINHFGNIACARLSDSTPYAGATRGTWRCVQVWFRKTTDWGGIWNQTSCRGNGDKPFRPAPENSLLRWIAAVLALLALSYTGHRVWESLRNQAPSSSAREGAPSLPPTAPSPRASSQTLPPSAMEPQSGIRIVTKCVLNGNTIYSEDACPQGSASTRVVTREDHNLMTGLTPAQLAAANRIRPAEPPMTTVGQSESPPHSTANECKALDEHIKYLDAMARQPQSGQTQDWIRDQRKKARDRQFAIRC